MSDREYGDQDDESPYNNAVGARLRRIRNQKRLTQHDVERVSGAEFKASVLGAYERGERALSMPRLERLARLYGVPVEDTLPSVEHLPVERRQVDTTGANLVLGLEQLGELDSDDVESIKRFVSLIQVQRQDFNGRMMSIRRADQATLAAMLDLRLDALPSRLESLGLIYHPD